MSSPRKKRSRRSPDRATSAPTPVGGASPRPARFGRTDWLLALGLLLVLISAYQPAWHGGLLWDDDKHLTQPALGSSEGLRRIWFELGATQQYYPLVHSAFWVQHRLWGDDTLGYHLANILLHGASACLLLLILRRLRVPGAWLAAAIFALHPVQVESVAWMTELKNTLSGLFYFGAALAYLTFDADRKRWRYATALVLFAAALLSKSVTATLPAALLVVFWWQRGRLLWRRDVLPLLPLLLLGVAAGFFTAWVERALIGAEGSEYEYSIGERILIAGRVLWFYLGKLVWPADLLFVYPRWSVSQAAWWQYLFPAGAAAALVSLWAIRARARGPLAAALLYAGTLVPVLGFFNVYPFRFSFVADHFQYLAMTPIVTLAAAGAVLATRRWPRLSAPARGAAFALVSLLAVLSWQQSRQYASAETLYRATLAKNPAAWLAHINLALPLFETNPDEATAHFEAALRLKPDLFEAHYNLGLAKLRGRRFAEAESHLREAIRLRPADAEARNSLGNLLLNLGRLAEAERECLAALAADPEMREAYFNLGNIYQAMGRLEPAAAQYAVALQHGLDAPAVRANLGNTLRGLGRLDEAITQLREALRLDPDSADTRYYLGNALQEAGRTEEAIEQYEAALRLAPRDGAVHNNFAVALESLGRFREAVEHYEQALKWRPDLVGARESLARARAAASARGVR